MSEKVDTASPTDSSQIAALLSALQHLSAALDSKPPFDMVGKKDSLCKLVLASYQEAYKERTENWKIIETKAQGTIAVAGIFIAGAFAYVDKAASATAFLQIPVVVAIIFLVISVLFAVQALKIQQVPVPPYGEFMRTNVERFLEIDQEADFKLRVEYFDYDQMREWHDVLAAIDGLIRRKVDYLWTAQAFLVASILAVAIFTVSRVVVK